MGHEPDVQGQIDDNSPSSRFFGEFNVLLREHGESPQDSMFNRLDAESKASFIAIG